jgi:hypothetical protein
MHVLAMIKQLVEWEQSCVKLVNKENKRIFSYASKQVTKHEKNYTPFLVEMAAMIWAMEHFETYLRGRHFTVFSDHKPLETSGKNMTKHCAESKKHLCNGILISKT